MYEPIISQINKSGCAVITVHKDRVRITIANVIKLKSRNNRIRKDLGMISYAKMEIVKTKLNENRVKIEFILKMPHSL